MIQAADLYALILVIAVLQVVALVATAPAVFQFMRVGMPVLMLGSVIGLMQTDAATVWTAAFTLAGLAFALLPAQARIVWTAINLAVVALCFTYLGAGALAAIQ